MSTPESEINHRQKLLSDAIDKLGEHFDSLVIIGTFDEGGVTHSLSDGSGNLFARYGSIVEWIDIYKATQCICPMDDDED